MVAEAYPPLHTTWAETPQRQEKAFTPKSQRCDHSLRKILGRAKKACECKVTYKSDSDQFCQEERDKISANYVRICGMKPKIFDLNQTFKKEITTKTKTKCTLVQHV